MNLSPKGEKGVSGLARITRLVLGGGALAFIGVLSFFSHLFVSGKALGGSIGEQNKGIDGAVDRLFSVPKAYADVPGAGGASSSGTDSGCTSIGSSASGSSGSGSDSGDSCACGCACS